MARDTDDLWSKDRDVELTASSGVVIEPEAWSKFS
jgi:hypothetical protein